jgi:hypothetical protein
MTAPNTIYANTDSHFVSSGGGVANGITASVVTQGNDGTSLPCKVCYITALCGSAVRMGIDSSVNISVGTLVPTVSAVSVGPISPLEIPIDDVSKLYFKSTVVSSVYITYRY